MRAGDSRHRRFLFDGIMVAPLSSHWQLALTPDYGFEQMPTTSLTQWWGGAGFLRFQPLGWFALAARAEVFHDGIGNQPIKNHVSAVGMR